MKTNKLLVIIDDIKDINAYKELGILSYALALKNYSVGYNNTYSLDEIGKLDTKCYIIINKLLSCEDIDNLKKMVLPKNVVGIITEDYGLLSIFNNIEIINFNMHYLTNYNTINLFLDDFNSCVVSTDITKEEIKEIFKNAKKDLILYLFGYNNVMYSKRKLLSNYNRFYNESLPNNSKINANEKMSFIVHESEDGTVFLTGDIYSSKSIMYDIEHVKYYLINTHFIAKEEVIRFITTDYNEYNEYFLNNKTYYDLKDEKNE